MIDIFQEVAEDLRAEKLRKTVARYGGVLLCILLAIVAGAGAWQGFRWWQDRRDTEAGTAYLEAVKGVQADPLTADARALGLHRLEALIASAPDGYKTLSSFKAAALKTNADQAREWDRTASVAQLYPELSQLAVLLWAACQLDGGDPDQIRPRLERLVSEGSLWMPLAREELALLSLREGRKDKALSELKALTGSGPESRGLSGRVRSLLVALDGP